MNFQKSLFAMALCALASGSCGKSHSSPKEEPADAVAITVTGEHVLRSQFNGRVLLYFSVDGAQLTRSVTFLCAVDEGPAELDCKSGVLDLNLDAYSAGEHKLTATALTNGDQRTVAKTSVSFCTGEGCTGQGTGDKTKAAEDKTAVDQTGATTKEPKEPRPPVTDGIPGAGVVGLPAGIPNTGTVFNIPIGIPTVKINVGRFWTMFLPPRYHIISTSSNKTFEGPSTIEYAQVMDDVYTRSPFCTPNTHRNGQIVTLLDGYGEPYSYCLTYFTLVEEFRLHAGLDRQLNSLEFSSPGVEPETYERFYFAATEARDGTVPPVPLVRFDNFCAGAYGRGEADIAMINNWWNDPLGLRPTRVFWCQTNMPGFGAGFDVWVAGFLFEETDGASNNASAVKLEMTYVASAAGLPTSFNPNVFLSGAAFRVSSMLLQTGLNAPFNSYNP